MHGGALVGLGATSVAESVRDRRDDPGEDGQASEPQLGIFLVFRVLDHRVQREVGRPGDGAENDHGKHEAEILGGEDAFGALVHPAIGDGFVSPFGHELFYFGCPAVVELLLGLSGIRRGG